MDYILWIKEGDGLRNRKLYSEFSFTQPTKLPKVTLKRKLENEYNDGQPITKKARRRESTFQDVVKKFKSMQ